MIAAITGFACLVVIVHAVIWLMYVSVMKLQALRDAGKLSPMQLKIGMIYVDFCLLGDVLANWFFTPFVFGEIAQEYTISQRLQRWVNSPNCRSHRMAMWFSRTLLNPYSVGGDHIVMPLVDKGTI